MYRSPLSEKQIKEARAKELKRSKGKRGKPDDPVTSDPKWFEDAMSRLVRGNHRLPDILNYTLPQFAMYLNAAERREAEARTHFVTDLASVVGGIFGGNKDLSKHIDSLVAVVTEEKKDGG